MTRGAAIPILQFNVDAGTPGMPDELVVLPAGVSEYADGNPITLTSAVAKRMIAEFASHGVELPVDWEHSTVTKGDKGEPAPAIGWIHDLYYDKKRGLVAKVHKWTAAARGYVLEEEYRYLSPVLQMENGEPYKLHSVALTNKPRTKNIKALLAASEKLLFSETDMPNETDDYKKALAALADALRANGATLADGADALTIVQRAHSVIGALKAPVWSAMSETVTLREALKLGADATVAAMKEKIGALSAGVGSVSVEQYNEATQRLNLLEAREKKREAETLVAKYVGEGRLNPNDTKQMDWANLAAMSDSTAFTNLMGNAPVVIPVGKTKLPTPTDKPDRKMVMATEARKYDAIDAKSRVTSKENFVNLELRSQGFAPLTKEELATV